MVPKPRCYSGEFEVCHTSYVLETFSAEIHTYPQTEQDCLCANWREFLSQAGEMPIFSLLVIHSFVIYEVMAGAILIGNALSAHSPSLLSKGWDAIITSSSRVGRERSYRKQTHPAAEPLLGCIGSDISSLDIPTSLNQHGWKETGSFTRRRQRFAEERGQPEQKGYALQPCEKEPVWKQKG